VKVSLAMLIRWLGRTWAEVVAASVEDRITDRYYFCGPSGRPCRPRWTSLVDVDASPSVATPVTGVQ